MITVRKHIITETAHRLMDYKGKCARIHGHSYKWEVEVAAPVQPNGITMDFATLKDVMRAEIEVPFDHVLVLRRDDPAADVLGFSDGVVRVAYNPTAENMARDIAARIDRALQSIMPNATLISLTCWETESSFARIVP